MTEKRMIEVLKDNALRHLKNKMNEYEQIQIKTDNDKIILNKLRQYYAGFTAPITYFSALDVIMSIRRAIHENN